MGVVEAVRGIDLDVANDEFVVLVGPSGCGKSTILRMIAGLEAPSGGEIAIDGAIVNEREPKDRDIAMVFQDYALYPHMTVAQNMGFALRYRGRVEGRDPRAGRHDRAPPRDRAARCRAPRASSPAASASASRWAARSSASRSSSSSTSLCQNLDAKLRVQMRTEIKKLRLRVPTTTIYVTHDQVEAMTLATTVSSSSTTASSEQVAGSPEEVYETPASTFVAGFMGAPAMNLLPAWREDGRVILADGTALVGPPGEAGEIWCGIRPEDMEWIPPGSASHRARPSPARRSPSSRSAPTRSSR